MCSCPQVPTYGIARTFLICWFVQAKDGLRCLPLFAAPTCATAPAPALTARLMAARAPRPRAPGRGQRRSSARASAAGCCASPPASLQRPSRHSAPSGPPGRGHLCGGRRGGRVCYADGTACVHQQRVPLRIVTVPARAHRHLSRLQALKELLPRRLHIVERISRGILHRPALCRKPPQIHRCCLSGKRDYDMVFAYFTRARSDQMNQRGGQPRAADV